jgi:hypothetical protein
MKTIIVVLVVLSTLGISAQNPFEDGIRSAGKIDFKGEESESIVYDFKISFPDDKSADYKFTQHWKDNQVDKTNTYELKWFWKDITYIKVDKELNVVELDTDLKVLESTMDNDTKLTLLNNRESDIAVYFKNLEDANKAADWAYNKVINSGGKAVFIK